MSAEIEHIVNMIDSTSSLARLKRRIDALGAPASSGRWGLLSFGLAALDARLDGGLAKGAVHEVLPTSGTDAASAAAFALMLAVRAGADGGPILWVSTDAELRRHGTPYGPGLAELGLVPDRMMLVTAPDELACLKVASDSIGCAGLAAAVIEVGSAKRLDLTASRRLALAAEKSGVTALILRGSDSMIASAAASRWQVAAAPSVPLAGQAPGRTGLSLSLVRHRGGARPFDICVEWDHDRTAFSEPALLRPVPAVAERRSMVA
jgi:protein ImuA